MLGTREVEPEGRALRGRGEGGQEAEEDLRKRGDVELEIFVGKKKKVVVINGRGKGSIMRGEFQERGACHEKMGTQRAKKPKTNGKSSA